MTTGARGSAGWIVSAPTPSADERRAARRDGQDDPGWIVRSECELRVGSLWTVEFGPGPDVLQRHRHVFEASDRPRRLALATTELRADGSRLTKR